MFTFRPENNSIIPYYNATKLPITKVDRGRGRERERDSERIKTTIKDEFKTRYFILNVQSFNLRSSSGNVMK